MPEIPGRPPGRLPLILLVCLAAAIPGSACAQDRGALPAPGPERLRALWDAGEPFDLFLASADARRDLWHDNYGGASVPPSLQERLDALRGSWRILVVAEDWCGDSAHTVPYLARLDQTTDRVDLRIVDSETGLDLMRSHRTPDGRAATPTAVLLDDAFRERGCFVERPPALQEWFLSARDSLSQRELLDRKYARYEADRGHQTLEEWVRILEDAEAGDARCVAKVIR